MSTRGVFITLEGGEGSGKSTVLRELEPRLRKAGRNVVLTEEPTGTELGRHIWRFFHEPGRPMVDSLAELLFFEAARAQHVKEVIGPALEQGEIVVSDRFGDSSVAYQGCARGLGVELVERLNAIATGGLAPDLTVLLDVPVGAGLRRARARSGDADDVIGTESSAFHEKVREGFLEIAKREPGRVVVVDASKPVGEVVEDVWAAVERALSGR